MAERQADLLDGLKRGIKRFSHLPIIQTEQQQGVTDAFIRSAGTEPVAQPAELQLLKGERFDRGRLAGHGEHEELLISVLTLNGPWAGGHGVEALI